MTQLRLGFASFQKGDFELIVSNRLTFKEIVLTGQMEGNPPLEKIDEILPTCVYVDAEAPRPPAGWFRMLCEATEKLTPKDTAMTREEFDLLSAVRTNEVAMDDDCKLYLFTQSQLVNTLRRLHDQIPQG